MIDQPPKFDKNQWHIAFYARDGYIPFGLGAEWEGSRVRVLNFRDSTARLEDGRTIPFPRRWFNIDTFNLNYYDVGKLVAKEHSL